VGIHEELDDILLIGLGDLVMLAQVSKTVGKCHQDRVVVLASVVHDDNDLRKRRTLAVDVIDVVVVEVLNVALHAERMGSETELHELLEILRHVQLGKVSFEADGLEPLGNPLHRNREDILVGELGSRQGRVLLEVVAYNGRSSQKSLLGHVDARGLIGADLQGDGQERRELFTGRGGPAAEVIAVFEVLDIGDNFVDLALWSQRSDITARSSSLATVVAVVGRHGVVGESWVFSER